MLDYLLELAKSPDHPLGLLILLLSSAIEYVFPPFPGDTITLFGAILITTYHWSFVGVMVMTTLGSLLGAALDFSLGALARRRAEAGKHLAEATRSRLQPILERFARHGELYIVLNRFLPGIRALFFYAAGLNGMRLWKVLLYAGLSAIGWNLLIILAGMALGASFDELKALAVDYSIGAWGLIGAVALFFMVRMLWRKARAKKEEQARRR